MKLIRGFTFDDPGITNSTSIEGYFMSGHLRYAPYDNDPRISHAHGWITGPMSTLTYCAAGLQVLMASGKTWAVSPSSGGLKSSEAGHSTNLGKFSSDVTSSDQALRNRFDTQANTSWSLGLK